MFQVGDRVRFIKRHARTGELNFGVDLNTQLQAAVVACADRDAVGIIETVYNHQLPRYDVRLLDGRLIDHVQAGFIEKLENV